MELERERERAKYVHVYANMKAYRMGGIRKQDAAKDLIWAYDHGCKSYLDIGCGRAEMLDIAESIGFLMVAGTEIVPELCEHEHVMEFAIHELDGIISRYDFVSCFDVIEHVQPGDDESLIVHMGDLAISNLCLTANNRPSVDPTTGNDLHINIRSYPEWNQMIRDLLEPDWKVMQCKDKDYVSETWRAWR